VQSQPRTNSYTTYGPSWRNIIALCHDLGLKKLEEEYQVGLGLGIGIFGGVRMKMIEREKKK
jgi:hypothetical protein